MPVFLPRQGFDFARWWKTCSTMAVKKIEAEDISEGASMKAPREEDDQRKKIQDRIMKVVGEEAQLPSNRRN